MDQEEIVQLYREMRRIRRFEEEAKLICQQYKISTNFYSYQNREAIAVGATSVTEADDFVLSSGRCHGIFLARGGSMSELFAEILGRPNGCCGGNAGPLNVFDVEHRFIGGWSINGTQLPIAAGFAYAQVFHDVPNVTLCFLTNDDLSNGLFCDTLALTKLWKLPLVFIVQNQHLSFVDYKSLKRAINIIPSDLNYDSIDGHDLFAVRGAIHTAITAARESRQCSIVEAHTVFNNNTDPEIVANDPLNILIKKLKAFRKLEAKEIIDQEIENEIQQAKRFLNNTANTEGYGE